MKTTSLALTDSRMRFATVVLPEPVPPEIPIIMLIFSRGLRRLRGSNPLINCSNNPLQQFGERLAYADTGGHYFFVVDRFVADPRGHVGDARNPEHFETHVSRDDGFRHGTHPDCVRAEIAQHSNLRRS